MKPDTGVGVENSNSLHGFVECLPAVTACVSFATCRDACRTTKSGECLLTVDEILSKKRCFGAMGFDGVYFRTDLSDKLLRTKVKS